VRRVTLNCEGGHMGVFPSSRFSVLSSQFQWSVVSNTQQSAFSEHQSQDEKGSRPFRREETVRRKPNRSENLVRSAGQALD
jgi:hypothetical protein